MKSFSATILSLFFTFSIIAQTSITGPYVSGNWYKIDSPFLIEGDITIHQDSSLTIEHGVEVVFQNEYSFTVDGTFEATGIFGDSILFTVQDTTGYASGTYTGWNGIRFNYPSDSSKLNYCIVEYSKVNGVYVEQSNLEVENSLVRNNTADGIYIVDGSGLDLHNSLIKNNKGDGLYIHYYSALNSTNTATSNNINRGIYISSDCSVTLNNFYADYNGGAGVSITLLHGGSIFFDGGSISNNLDGGFYINNQSDNITLKNLIIEGNDKTGNGGGICVEGDEFIECGFTGIDLLIDNNSATSGAGIYSIYASIEIDSTTISNNDADLLSGWGGGIYTDLGDLALSNSSIFNCDAWRGGGIYIHNTWEYPGQIVELDSTVIEYCNADLGGGLYLLLEDAAMTIDRSQITNNIASDNGGGIYVGLAPAYLDIINTTFYNNQAGTGGNALITYSPFVEPDLMNCIVWGHNEPAISCQGGASLPTISYSDIQGTGLYPGTGNINEDPLFVDPGNGDFHLNWINFPIPDVTKSPCIDKGNPGSPLDPDGTRTDMGAYYYHQTFTSISGNINDTLKCSESPYYVFGDLTVLSGDDLVIEPCVHLVFMDDYRLNVEGQLQANGNSTDYIWFYPADTSIGWQGIRFLNQNSNGQDSSKLEFCKIKYAKADGPGEDAKGGGVYCNNSSELLIKQCELSYNSAEKGGGIYCDSLSNPLISENVLENNQAILGGGIYGDSSSFQLDDCDIRYNTATDKGGGIYVRAASFPLITDNNISGNTALSGGGIYADSSSFQLEDCYIDHNTATDKGGGIYVRAASSPLITDNIFENNQAVLGGGIYGDSSSFQLEDCDIRYNNATGKGGGIYVRAASFPLITDNIIIENIALSGGGIYADSSNCQVSSCFFLYNKATEKGGGIYCNGSSIPVFTNDTILYNQANKGGGLYTYTSNLQITDSYIAGNQATKGGGMYIDSSDYQITNGVISWNIAEYQGGGIYQRLGIANISSVQFNNNDGTFTGGGIFCEDANLTLSNLNFTNNSALSIGAGIYSSGSILDLNNVEFSGCWLEQGNGGGMYISGSPDCNLTDVTISNCHAYNGSGGGLYCSSSTLSMLNVEINGNTSEYEGAGLYCSSSTISMLNIEINNNSSDNHGGGIYTKSTNLDIEKSLIYNNLATSGGGLYLKDNSSIDILNTTIVNNSSGSGTAIYAESGSSANLLNSIIWQHTAPPFTGAGSFTIDYSDVEGGWAGTGNINADPLFIDPGNENFNLSWINFPIPDVTKSPCIDTGDPFSPLDPDSTRADMGALYHHYDLTPFNPVITSISDVPDDQGKQVVISWDKSLLDDDIYNYITNYTIWRMQNWAKTPWEYIGEIPAHFFDEYAYIAPTISDSTAMGIPYYTYLVSAETADPYVFYNSLADSGYSVDNLAPEPPKGFYGYQEEGYIVLNWNASGDEDFDFFGIYKTYDLQNFPEDPFVTLTETTYIDQLEKSDSLYYYVTAFDINGNESGASDTIGIPFSKSVNITVFLEGPFLISQMIPYLNLGGYIPLIQPYNQPPWNYTGDEAVGLIPNSDIVDWLLLEFRDAPDPASAGGASAIYRMAAFLKADGNIVGLDGVNPPRVNLEYNHYLYLVIWHRNHLGIMSGLNVTELPDSFTYDFTDTADKTYGGEKAVKFLNTGIWGMISADGNADGQINNQDKNDIWWPQLYNTGYYPGDFNMDTEVNLMDIENLWKSNSGKSSFVPE